MATATKTQKKTAKRSPNGSATITAKQAEQLLNADTRVRQLRAELEQAEGELAKARERYHARIPLSRDKDERKRKIRTASIGGVTVRVTPTRTGDKLSLKRYCDAGHEITPEMREAITPGRPYDRWTVKAATS